MVVCWGSNQKGILSNGMYPGSDDPDTPWHAVGNPGPTSVAVTNSPVAVASLALGTWSTCSGGGGTVACWAPTS